MGKIHLLVRAHDAEGLERLLRAQDDASVLANLLDAQGAPPLFHAVDADVADARIVRMLLEAGADVDFLTQGTRSESTLSRALRTGSLEIVRLFASHGADFNNTNADGSNAILDAVYSSKDGTEVLDYLLGLGLSPEVESRFGEVPIVVAMRRGKFQMVERLVAAGADETPIGWTPLIRAAAIGTVQDVEFELAKGPDVEATDEPGHTAFHVALMRGDEAIANALLAAGAAIAFGGGDTASCLHHAVSGGNASLVLLMLEAGSSGDGWDTLNATALACAAAGDHELVRLLLERGADPSTGQSFNSILWEAKDRKTILTLLEAGADPSELDREGLRKLVGLAESRTSALEEVTREQYLAARYEREGVANPEDMTEPFRVAMIRGGNNASCARKQFDDPPTFARGLSWKSRPPQVWCFERYGQSFSLMPDGRTLQIAGEHEDWYDPDFCIYNDVTVFFPGGGIRVFGYPYDVFQPTDFHTATRVGHQIWVVGGLGYPDQRNGPIPVYRLDARDYSIEAVATTGEVPPRIHSHRADWVGGAIVVRGGEVITFPSGKETHTKNASVFRLDLESRVWERLTE